MMPKVIDKAPHDGSIINVGAWIFRPEKKFVTGKAYFDGLHWRWAFNREKCYPVHFTD